jgi:GTP-binding protein
MIIRSIDFYGSVVSPKGYPNDLFPQIVLAGRSNVGKSSFINAMLNNHKVARVAKTPGKTRLLNFFLINQSFYFVDVPGYGFANVAKSQLEMFRDMIETYLENSRSLALAILLLDMRHLPTEDDLQMYRYLKNKGLPVIIILTKSDKLSGNGKAKQKQLISKAILLQEPDRMIPFSSVTKAETSIVWEQIEKLLPVIKSEENSK